MSRVFVFPMAGLSQRFSEAGFRLPKYMLPAGGRYLFDYAVSSFKKHFESEVFVFVVRDIFDTPDFVRERCEVLGISNFHIVVIHSPTRGQAETVALGLVGLKSMWNNQLIIFNIDTFLIEGSVPEEFFSKGLDGSLLVFKGKGNNWSYVEPFDNTERMVKRTAEKVPISNLCCTGLYSFASVAMFLRFFEIYYQKFLDDLNPGELYVAPMYNYLISDGLSVGYELIPSGSVFFFGIPSEYYDFIADLSALEMFPVF